MYWRASAWSATSFVLRPTARQRSPYSMAEPVEPDVDRALDHVPSRRQAPDGPEGRLERRDGLEVGRPSHGARGDLAVVHRGLRPRLAAGRVIGERLEVTGETVAVDRLDRLDDPRVEGSPLLPEQARGGDVAGERVPPPVLEVGEEPGLVEEG